MKKLNNFLLTLLLLVAGGASVRAMEWPGEGCWCSKQEWNLLSEEAQLDALASLTTAIDEELAGEKTALQFYYWVPQTVFDADISAEDWAQMSEGERNQLLAVLTTSASTASDSSGSSSPTTPVTNQAPVTNITGEFDVVNVQGLQQYGFTCGAYALYHAYLLAQSPDIHLNQELLNGLVEAQTLGFTENASGGQLNAMLQNLVSTGWLREGQVHIVDSTGFESWLSDRCVSPLTNSITVNLSEGKPLVFVLNTTLTSDPENVDHWIAVRVDAQEDGWLLLTVVNSGQGLYATENPALQGLVNVIMQELGDHGLLTQEEYVQPETTQTATEPSKLTQVEIDRKIREEQDLEYAASERIDMEKDRVAREEQARIASEQEERAQQERDQITQQLRETGEYDALIVQLAKAGNDRSKIGKICNQIAPQGSTNGNLEKSRVARQVAGLLFRGNETVAQIQACFPHGMCSKERAQRFLENYNASR